MKEESEEMIKEEWREFKLHMNSGSRIRKKEKRTDGCEC